MSDMTTIQDPDPPGGSETSSPEDAAAPVPETAAQAVARVIATDPRFAVGEAEIRGVRYRVFRKFLSLQCDLTNSTSHVVSVSSQ